MDDQGDDAGTEPRTPPPGFVERYRSLFEEHPHAVFALDLEAQLVEVNPAAGRISGFTADQLLGMNMADLVVPEQLEAVFDAFSEALQRRPQRMELTIKRADGRLADLDVTAIPLVVEDQVVGAYGVAEDITERNAVARELVVTRQLAAEAGEVRTDFVARMSHEIRTPLTSILATIELLSTTETTEEQQPLVETLQRSGRRLLRLVDSVLDFSATGQEARLVAEKFDLHLLVHDAVDLVNGSARLKGLTIDLEVADDVPRWVRDHPTWTSQILVNLLTNAVAFTESGGVSLAVSTTSAREHRSVVYRVSDTGVGIDPAHQDVVFEPFARVRAVVDPEPGTGLGLSIVRQLVAISGGSIDVRSTPGHGSAFTVVMPLRDLDGTDGAAPTDQAGGA